VLTVSRARSGKFYQINILVAGWAGYIGARTCAELFNKGFTPSYIDTLR
jgi:UDP-glucose 4-epimerase